MGILTEDAAAACNLRGDLVIFTLFVIVIFVCMGVIRREKSDIHNGHKIKLHLFVNAATF